MSSILYNTLMWGWIEEDVITYYLLWMGHQMMDVRLSLCLIKQVTYFFVLFNAHVIYCNILFKLFDIIVYYFADIDTYDGDEPPQ